jgi:hypothetical protein
MLATLLRVLLEMCKHVEVRVERFVRFGIDKKLLKSIKHGIRH